MNSNRTNFDATFCGKLPLHQTNLIQPHGLLILVSKEDYKVVQVSENIASFLSIEVADFIEKPFEDFLEDESYMRFKKKTSRPFNGKLPVALSFKKAKQQKQSLAVVHEQEKCLLVEIELDEYVIPNQSSFATVFQEMKQLTNAINAASGLEEVCGIAAKGIKEFSGFDKVMMYTFDEEWNGSVIAEEMEEGMASYLGLKFPASDIPKPARDMYLKNPYRLIPNRNYTPVRLYPLLNPYTHTFTNLAETELRSVASVHLEYLKNMNVVASMSTRIVQNDKLWGLISCHHRTPKYLSIEERSVFEWLSDVISAKITALNIKKSIGLKDQLNDQYTALVEEIYKQKTLPEVWAENKEEIKNYLNTDGLAFCWNGQIETVGTVPEKDEVDVLQYWLQGKPGNKLYHESSLSRVFDEANKFSEVGSGILALPIQAEKGNFMIGFRQEAIKKVDWGGNPNEAVQFETNSSVYHPRNSFTQWQEVVRHTAEPWLNEEIQAAENLRNVLVEFILNKTNE